MANYVAYPDIVEKIRSGRLDGQLLSLIHECEQRQEDRKDQLRMRVKDIFGENAVIVVEPRTPNTILCGAEEGGVATCGPAADCPHGA